MKSYIRVSRQEVMHRGAEALAEAMNGVDLLMLPNENNIRVDERTGDFLVEVDVPEEPRGLLL